MPGDPIVVESGSDEPPRPLEDVPLPEPARLNLGVLGPTRIEGLYTDADLCGGATDGGDDMDAIEEATRPVEWPGVAPIPAYAERPDDA